MSGRAVTARTGGRGADAGGRSAPDDRVVDRWLVAGLCAALALGMGWHVLRGDPATGGRGMGGVTTTHTAAADGVPDPSADQLARGLALLDEGDPGAAARALAGALHAQPSNDEARFRLAQALDRAGRIDAALALWKQVLARAERSGDRRRASYARVRIEILRAVASTRGPPVSARDGGS
jgi:tetratricopeptide (TPR) repeat protein